MKTCRVLGFATGSVIRQHRQALQRLCHVKLLAHSGAASPAYQSATTGPRRTFSQQWRASPLPSAPDVATRVRSVLRRMPQSVVVVTVAPPTSRPTTGDQQPASELSGGTKEQQQQQQPVGMTVSSFASLDLEGDVAAVAFNVRRPSQTLDAIARGSGIFNVHVLAGDDAGARIAHHFTQPNAKMGDAATASAATATGLFDDLERRAGCTVVAAADGGPPMLRGPGVLYVLTCAVPSPSDGLMMLPVMSHTIVVAGVTDVSVGEAVGGLGPSPDRDGSSEENQAALLGLSYGDRRYRAPGRALLGGDGSGSAVEETIDD